MPAAPEPKSGVVAYGAVMDKAPESVRALSGRSMFFTTASNQAAFHAVENEQDSYSQVSFRTDVQRPTSRAQRPRFTRTPDLSL